MIFRRWPGLFLLRSSGRIHYPGGVWGASLFLGLAGCAPQLVDRTASPLEYNEPLNIQEFAADASVGGNREIRGVTLELGGSLKPMAIATDDRWRVRAALPSCDEVVAYRYLVDYDEASDTTPPFQRKIFPDTGRFIRQINYRPGACEGEPDVGTRSWSVSVDDDLPDANPGDGFCSTTDSPDDRDSECSLRAAVMESNARPGIDRIQLTRFGPFVLTRTGPESDDEPDAGVGDLDITDSLVIDGSGGAGCYDNVDDFLNPRSSPEPYRNREPRGHRLAIDANGIDRVLDIYAGGPEQDVEVYLSCLQVTGGRRTGPNDEFTNERGGGILNRGILVTDRVVVSENGIAGLTSRGAGIYNAGTLVFRNSALVHNQGALRGQVAGGTDGGGLYNDTGARAEIDRSVLAFNKATRGPGVFNGNRLREPGSDRPANVAITNSTVADHTGGESAAQWQAALLNWRGSVMRIAWSTVVDNRSAPLLYNAGRLELGNSLFESYADELCTSGDTGVVSLGGNWFNSDDCLTPARSGDVIVPRLPGIDRRLQDNGGFTPTLEIRAPEGSEAPYPVDRPPVGLPLCPPLDQRGFTRPADGTGDGRTECDPGAYEVGASRP